MEHAYIDVATSWFQQLQEALIEDKPNVVIYEIAKRGEEERQELIKSVLLLQEAVSKLQDQKATILGAKQ